MKVNLYCIYDVKTSVFHAPTCAINDHGAKRHFSKIFADPRHPYYDYSEDYSLICVGQFSDESGEVNGSVHEHVCSGNELREMAETLRSRRPNEQ